MPSYLKDANTTVTHALPASAGSVTTADIDLGSNQGNYGSDFTGNVEVLITVPALTTSQLPDAATLTLLLQNGSSAGPTTAFDNSFVITGAGGAGTNGVANTFRARLPSNVLRYLNLKATSANSPGNMSAVSAELALVYSNQG